MSTHRMHATAPHRAVTEFPFAPGDLRRVRAFVDARANDAGLSRHRADDLTAVVNELATNSVDHGGGTGTVRSWLEPHALVMEVEDAGRLAEPHAAGRAAPRLDQERGRGLWMARQLADTLDIRPTVHGTAFRVHTWL